MRRSTTRFCALALLAGLLFACTTDDDPAPLTPTATVDPITNYGGPFLTDGLQTSATACTAESGCVSEPPPLAELPTSPLPLSVQTIGDFTIGIPQGYNAIQAGDEVLIVAADSSIAGGFTVSVRALNAPPAAPPAPYANLPTNDDPLGADFARVTWREAGDGLLFYGFTGPEGPVVVLEAFANSAQNWRVFRPTAVEMLGTLAFRP
ncbi:MAG: hypothetical protein ACLFTK_17245 [Anaerolineales bacterium]